MTITLRKRTEDNAQSVLALRCTLGQERFVSSVTDSLLTSYVPGGGGPSGFYARLGFVPTGELDPVGDHSAPKRA